MKNEVTEKTDFYFFEQVHRCHFLTYEKQKKNAENYCYYTILEKVNTSQEGKGLYIIFISIKSKGANSYWIKLNKSRIKKK